tara:strand:- start:145 stop:789 length:645 start_codon:yes stop_codon:yes gene_type:complete
MKRNISPSILSADFTIIKDQIQSVENAGATRLHIDVMDGHFVPNLTFGPFIIKQIRKLSNIHFETHLMIENPDKYLQDYIDAGSDTLIFHYEASNDINRDIDTIKDNNVLAGIAINPDTKAEVLKPFIDSIDYILVMSVFPGFGGQSFISETLDTMRRLVDLREDRDILIGVDGGVNINTIAQVYETGVDVTIVGSGLYKADSIKDRFSELMSV